MFSKSIAYTRQVVLKHSQKRKNCLYSKKPV